ncbi:MAG: sec-independent protein translocase protein TatC [Candidatus Krumholzibacteriia bacterium]
MSTVNDPPDEEPTDFTGPRDQVGFDDLGAADDSPPSEPDPPVEDRMGLLDHLDELRTVLIHSSIAAVAATILCWFWSADLLDILIRPIENEGIYFTAPNEAFLTRLKLAAVVGFFVVAPFIFFKIYSFVLPGLYKQERKVVTPLILATTILFYLGVSFAFLVVIPQVMTFLLSFGTENLSPLIGVGPYFAFVSRLCLAFGLVFELPLLVLFLSVLGIVNPRVLLRTWRYAVIAIAGLSAVLTPPDVVSQVMMAGPVLLLYIGSVLVSIVVVRNKKKSADSEDSDSDE